MTLYNPNEAIAQIAAGFKQVVFDQIPRLNGSDYPRGAPPLPAGLVMPPAINYRETMRVGTVRLDYELWFLESIAGGFENQKNLWRYLAWAGSESPLALLDANPSLGIVGADGTPRVDAHVMDNRPLNVQDLAYIESSGFGIALLAPVYVTNKE